MWPFSIAEPNKTSTSSDSNSTLTDDQIDSALKKVDSDFFDTLPSSIKQKFYGFMLGMSRFSFGAREALLWLPSSAQEGLPEPSVSDVRNYIAERAQLEFEYQQPRTSTTCYESQSDSQKPTSVFDAIQTQCREGVLDTYSSYAVIGTSSAQKELITVGQRDCIVITIFNKDTHQTLLAHLVTDMDAPQFFDKSLIPGSQDCRMVPADEQQKSDFLGVAHYETASDCHVRQFPIEWYIAAFRQKYFGGQNTASLEISIVASSMTPTLAVDTAAASLKKYFFVSSIRYPRAHHPQIKTSISSADGTISIEGEDFVEAHEGTFYPGGLVEIKETSI